MSHSAFTSCSGRGLHFKSASMCASRSLYGFSATAEEAMPCFGQLLRCPEDPQKGLPLRSIWQLLRSSLERCACLLLISIAKRLCKTLKLGPQSRCRMQTLLVSALWKQPVKLLRWPRPHTARWIPWQLVKLVESGAFGYALLCARNQDPTCHVQRGCVQLVATAPTPCHRVAERGICLRLLAWFWQIGVVVGQRLPLKEQDLKKRSSDASQPDPALLDRVPNCALPDCLGLLDHKL